MCTCAQCVLVTGVIDKCNYINRFLLFCLIVHCDALIPEQEDVSDEDEDPDGKKSTHKAKAAAAAAAATVAAAAKEAKEKKENKVAVLSTVPIYRSLVDCCLLLSNPKRATQLSQSAQSTDTFECRS
jgi:hypothetical protein